MKEQARVAWIDGVKGLCCVFIFLGHYYGMVKDENIGEVTKFIFEKILWFVVSGNFAVNIFCVLSGFVATKKSIKSFSELIKTIWHRYIRFLICYVSAYLVIAIILFTIGFHTSNSGLSNDTVKTYMIDMPTIFLFVKDILTLGCVLNGPLWTIHPIFYANIIIYVVNYIIGKKRLKVYFLAVISFVLLVFGILTNSNIWFVGVTMLGSCLELIPQEIEWGGADYFIIIVLIMVNYIHNSNNYYNSYCAFFFLILVTISKKCKVFLMKEFLVTLYRLSTAVYFCHFPIICSVSIVVWKICKNLSMNPRMIFRVDLVISILAVLGIAEYSRAAEPPVRCGGSHLSGLAEPPVRCGGSHLSGLAEPLIFNNYCIRFLLIP